MTADRSATSPDTHGAPDPQAGVPWVVVSRPRQAREAPESPRRLALLVALGAVIVLLAVAVVGVLAARKLAEREAVNDAANTADLLAEAVVQPALEEGLLRGDQQAVDALDEVLRPYVASSSLVRVKVWARDGRILYSDEPRLVGEQFDLSPEEQAVFEHPVTKADVSDLDEPENRFERGQGKLLEAYRPVWTPAGQPLLFETYAPYDEVDARAGELWRGFAGVTVSSLLLFVALIVPLLWRLLARLRETQRQREAALERAVEASDDERRRIAGALHDGLVQELAATSYAVSGAAARAETVDPRLAADLATISGTLRDGIGSLRSLLVDIYPPTLQSAGLLEALRDLATSLRSRDIEVVLDVPDEDPGLGPELDRLVFRIAHECLHNVRRHASASTVTVGLRREGPDLEFRVADDGVGFDVGAAYERPESGHLGLRVLADVATDAGAELAVASAPGAGTVWRLRATLP